MRIAAEDLLKRDLVGDPRMVKPAWTIGKRHLPPALQPSGDGRNERGIANETGGSQRHLIIDVLSLQRGQGTRPSGDLRLCAPLLRYGHGWLFGDINPVLRAARPVPLEPVLQYHSPPIIQSMFIRGS